LKLNILGHSLAKASLEIDFWDLQVKIKIVPIEIIGQ